MSLKSVLTTIADTIRSKTGITKELRLDEMPNAINEVHEAGKQAEYDAFWNAFQEDGKRKNYNHCFSGACWVEDNYKPKYPFGEITNCSNMFMVSSITDTLYSMDVKKVGSLTSTFNNASFLKTIRLLTVGENTKFASTFNGNTSLENIEFGGTIAQNGLDLQWSTKLNKASITSIINALSTTTSGLSITLSLTAVNNAFEGGSTGAEWLALIATKSNWTINLA